MRSTFCSHIKGRGYCSARACIYGHTRTHTCTWIFLSYYSALYFLSQFLVFFLIISFLPSCFRAIRKYVFFHKIYHTLSSSHMNSIEGSWHLDVHSKYYLNPVAICVFSLQWLALVVLGQFYSGFLPPEHLSIITSRMLMSQVICIHQYLALKQQDVPLMSFQKMYHIAYFSR